MKKLIYIYLATVNLLNIFITAVFGYQSGGSLHPGIFIRGIILALLLHYFFSDYREIRKNIFTRSVLFFLIFYFFQIFLIEGVLYEFEFIARSLAYTLRIIFYLVLAYYIYVNYEYFASKVDSIFLINAIVVLANIIIGYYFKIGVQSYSAIEDSYRGFMAGNDSSIFAFVAFGFGIYNYNKRRVLSIVIMALSILAMYIIATKAFFVAGIILLLYFIHSIKVKVKLLPILLSLIVLFFAYKNYQDVIEERLLLDYTRSIAQGEKVLETSTYKESYVLNTLNKIAPGRIVQGVAMFNQFISDKVEVLLLGYGVGGLYFEFGRPPMMDLFMMMGFYGTIGFLCIYLPLFKTVVKIIINKDFDFVGTIFLTMLLYGSLGGFLMGSANTNSIFALVFGVLISKYYPLKEIKGLEST